MGDTTGAAALDTATVYTASAETVLADLGDPVETEEQAADPKEAPHNDKSGSGDALECVVTDFGRVRGVNIAEVNAAHHLPHEHPNQKDDVQSDTAVLAGHVGEARDEVSVVGFGGVVRCTEAHKHVETHRNMPKEVYGS